MKEVLTRGHLDALLSVITEASKWVSPFHWTGDCCSEEDVVAAREIADRIEALLPPGEA